MLAALDRFGIGTFKNYNQGDNVYINGGDRQEFSDIVLAGSSAGMICWFEAGVTDSFGPQLDGMRDGLGLLPGSACPHYDGEERRRPVYQELVANGFPPGIAADDAVALHYVGTELREVLTTREDACAYRVEPGSETRIEPRLLGKE